MFLEQSCRILPFARPTELVFTLLSSSSLVHFRAICPLLHAESGLLISPPPGPDGNRFEPHLGLEAAHLFGEVVAGRAERFLDYHFQFAHHCDAEPPQALENKADGWLIVASDFCVTLGLEGSLTAVACAAAHRHVRSTHCARKPRRPCWSSASARKRRLNELLEQFVVRHRGSNSTKYFSFSA